MRVLRLLFNPNLRVDGTKRVLTIFASVDAAETRVTAGVSSSWLRFWLLNSAHYKHIVCQHYHS